MSDISGTGVQGGVQSVERAVALLTAVADSPEPEPVSVLAERCSLNRTTAWRILGTLEDHELVERDPATNRYRVGHAAARLAAAVGHEPLARSADPLLRQLAEQSGETVSLAVPRGPQLVYVTQVQAPRVMTADWLGRFTPLHATSTGKAYLAWLPEPELASALARPLERFTDTTITEPASLREELVEVRLRGYAVSCGELEAALWGVSAPVLDTDGRPIAIVSVWGAEARVRVRGIERIGELTAAVGKEVAAVVAR